MTQMPHLPVMEWDYRDQLHATLRRTVVTVSDPRADKLLRSGTVPLPSGVELGPALVLGGLWRRLRTVLQGMVRRTVPDLGAPALDRLGHRPHAHNRRKTLTGVRTINSRS
jgi:hypothetical protein